MKCKQMKDRNETITPPIYMHVIHSSTQMIDFSFSLTFPYYSSKRLKTLKFQVSLSFWDLLPHTQYKYVCHTFSKNILRFSPPFDIIQKDIKCKTMRE